MRHLFTCLSQRSVFSCSSLSFPGAAVDRCSFWCRSKPQWWWLLFIAHSSPHDSPLTWCTELFAAGSFPEHLLTLAFGFFLLWVFFVGFHFVWTSNVPWQHSLISDDQICPVLGCFSSPWSFHLECECAAGSWEMQELLYKFNLCFSNQCCPERAWFAGTAEKGCRCNKTDTDKGLSQALKHMNKLLLLMEN